jgi:TIR domain
MDSGHAPQVFLSYARPDEARVRRVHERLGQAGIDCWLDRDDIAPGAAWETEVKQALTRARLVLVCLSKQSRARDGFLQKEIRWALDAWGQKAPGQIFLIPVKLEECDIDDRLAQFHWVDAWEERGWQQLISQIKRCVPSAASSDAVADRRPVQAEAALSPLQKRKLQTQNALSIPYVTFPAEVRRFLRDSMSTEDWLSLSDETLRFVTTLGCKLEPIVQIVPATPTPLVLGFECLGLGALGESFEDICRTARDVDPGLLRLCLAVVSIKTVSTLRTEAVKSGHTGARNLMFSMNLDPFMLDNPHFKKFLLWYFTDLSHNVLFEVNETTTRQYLPKLKNLQVDFNLRYSADDLNNWHADVREALIDRVEMTKMDYRSFKQAMAVRGDDARRSLDMLLQHNMADKPLIVEGIEDRDYLEFLERHWDFKRHGHLYGQGYCLDSSHHWNSAIQPLKDYCLPGGSYLAEQAELPLEGTTRH